MLRVNDLSKRFGGIRAVDGVSFEVTAGECVALIGPNGAGKSTCFACIAGQYLPDGGSIEWKGSRLNRMSPAARLQQGVARSFQVAQVFEALTVLQNVQLAEQARLERSGFLSPISAFKRLASQAHGPAMALLEKTGLAELADRDALSLPYGAKKRLELALALAGITNADLDGKAESSPRLLLLDEPAAGLAEQERASLMRLVKGLAHEGIAVLYTEHNMDAVAEVADRVLVLIEGKLAAMGSFDEISRNSVVRSRYLGEGRGRA
jgi:branched-chain amino acid transport system ATP-binding protein